MLFNETSAQFRPLSVLGCLNIERDVRCDVKHDVMCDVSVMFNYDFRCDV